MHRKFVASVPEFGEELGDRLFSLLEDPRVEAVRAVSGYVGIETIRRLGDAVQARPDLSVSLVVGMAAREGISQRTYDELGNLSSALRQRGASSRSNFSNVYWFFSGPGGTRDRGMHAKAYRFHGDGVGKLIVGSSNFSFSGLSRRGNVEVNLVESDQAVLDVFDDFFNTHLMDGYSFVPFEKVKDFPIRGTKKKQAERVGRGLLKVPKPVEFHDLPYLDIDLARDVDKKTRSSLNVSFGRGRWSRSTGVVRPREYYEVEIIVPKEVNSDPNYPRGDFLAVTSDGFSFDARTQGDNFKNLRSRQDLSVLGLWMKGLLSEAGALDPESEEMVTSETFEEYGNSILRMYLKNKKEVILHFPRDREFL